MKNKTRFFLFVIVSGVSCSFLSAQTVHQPFNGKNLEGWSVVGGKPEKSFWKVGTATMSRKTPTGLEFLLPENGKGDLVNLSGSNWQNDPTQRGLDLQTNRTFGDCTVDLEFMVPKGSNSGIYLMGEYEVQICDSWGLTGKLTQGDLGAVYSAAEPKLPAAREPGQWQTVHIDFEAPRFDKAGKKIRNAKFLRVVINGKLVQENVEVPNGSTGGGITGKESTKGPLMLQGNHGPVVYRNIRIVEK